ncbi:MAG: ribonucleoside-diphosphate reductase subunit alpha [Candidatus Babeliales bacterium]
MLTPEAQILTGFREQVGKQIRVTNRQGALVPFDEQIVYEVLHKTIRGFETEVSALLIFQEFLKNIYDTVTTQEIEKALVLAAVAFIEQDPSYDIVATRLLLNRSYRETFGQTVNNNVYELYQYAFVQSIQTGIEHGVLDQRLQEFNLPYLATKLRAERDELLTYLGLQTLYERYFYKIAKRKMEAPQMFWMRIAMGLAINEANKNERAIEFYEVLSTLRYVSSTPTLFHSGYKIPQLSSCYLSTVSDDLGHIFKVIGDNAQLAKWAGGIGNDWTNIRGTGSFIKSIHATSQGVIPYLKIVNDVVVAITRSGIRRGGTCVYLETWHIDIEDFLDLRRNTGDERRRAHDMNTANWIPDLFMKRIKDDADWTLFSPHDTPDLHDLYGKAFEKRYCEYEQLARDGKIEQFRTVPAKKLWRKMLSRLFETGHPWITFKDPCNIRSPQDHVGVVHSSNLCTEITLNTSETETAVCNLGSINIAQYIIDGALDVELMGKTITSAVRMLDNVIDINFYPTKEARTSNLRHRPIGLGMMGVQDALYMLNIPFDSDKALEFCDYITEVYSFYAIAASSQLAQERGTYETYRGSKWDRGIFPLDTITLLEHERGEYVDVNRTMRLDWQPLREQVRACGMRNSNVMAIAPTATIANIAGCYPSIEPIYKNLYVKSNITGEFTIINKYLVADLKKLGLWSSTMIEQLKYYDGELELIAGIPDALKRKYKCAFEIDPVDFIKLTAVRSKWIDQSQSHNVFMKGVSGKKLEEIYFAAWQAGLKTTYYLRTLGATQIEKSTLDAGKYGFTQKRDYQAMPSEAAEEKENTLMQSPQGEAVTYKAGTICDLMGPDCESCQ